MTTDIQPVYGEPALRVHDILAIGDLHIGLESHLRKKGFNLVSRTGEMLERIEAMSEGCSRLLVLGDVKDSVPGSSKQEFAEIPGFFDSLLGMFSEIDVVRGNHDTEIEEFLPGRVRIRPATGMVADGIGFVHGHTWPSADVMSCGTLVMAHNHPTVMFRDGVGRQTTEPCWVRARFRDGPTERYVRLPEEVIVMPAFNRMLGGAPVNAEGDGLLGPILNNDLVDLDNARIYLLDGIELGRRIDLMVDAPGAARTRRRAAEGPNRRAKYSRSLFHLV